MIEVRYLRIYYTPYLYWGQTEGEIFFTIEKENSRAQGIMSMSQFS